MKDGGRQRLTRADSCRMTDASDITQSLRGAKGRPGVRRGRAEMTPATDSGTSSWLHSPAFMGSTAESPRSMVHWPAAHLSVAQLLGAAANIASRRPSLLPLVSGSPKPTPCPLIFCNVASPHSSSRSTTARRGAGLYAGELLLPARLP